MCITASELARRIGVSKGAISQWKAPGCIPAERCPAIELQAKGAITCEVLRPDVRWARVPDAGWPHPSGRPCIDVACPELIDAAGAPDVSAVAAQA